MEKRISLLELENKTNTSMIINYLESLIADEMILNSYVRDMRIISANTSSVFIEVNSLQAKEIIEENYMKALEQATESIYEGKIKPEIILRGETPIYTQSNGVANKNISPKFTFDSYVVSEFNQEVVGMAKRVLKNPGKFSPLYITSKSGLGKTHLLHAIGNESQKKGLSSAYIEPNLFTKKIQEFSIKGSGSISTYAESLKKYDILLFDDIQNLGDRSVTLRVLFEIINSHIEKDKQIIIVSDKVAQELSGFEARFITRFVSGISSVIKQPNEKDITKILKFKLDEEKLNPENWEREALDFIARNNTSSIRSLEGAIKRIAFYTENDNDVKYTYTVISNIFKNLAVDPSELTPGRIIEIVAKYYKIYKKDLIGKSRKKEYVQPRHMAIYLVREITKLGYVEIGKFFGGRDHSTIMSAYKTVNRNIKINKAVQMAVSAIEQKIKTIS